MIDNKFLVKIFVFISMSFLYGACQDKCPICFTGYSGERIFFYDEGVNILDTNSGISIDYIEMKGHGKVRPDGYEVKDFVVSPTDLERDWYLNLQAGEVAEYCTGEECDLYLYFDGIERIDTITMRIDIIREGCCTAIPTTVFEVNGEPVMERHRTLGGWIIRT